MVINALRRHFFLPGIPVAITFVLLSNGADAMSICFNSVAVIFLCEIDEAVYNFVLSHQMRAETTRAGEKIRVTLNEDEEQAIFQSRFVLQVSIVVVSRMGLWIMANGTNISAMVGTWFLAFLTFVPADVTWILRRRNEAGAKAAGVVILQVLVAFVGFAVWSSFGVVFSLKYG